MILGTVSTVEIGLLGGYLAARPDALLYQYCTVLLLEPEPAILQKRRGKGTFVCSLDPELNHHLHFSLALPRFLTASRPEARMKSAG